MGHRMPLVLCLSASLLLAASAGQAEGEEKPMVVEQGREVGIEYTLKLDDGTTADSNVGGEPLRYRQGLGMILPALEESLVGLQVNDQKQVTLPPATGYGEVDPKAFQTVEIDMIPEPARQAGTQLTAQSPDGRQRPVKVKEIQGDKAVLDFNHPLAGETLHFDVKILSIE